MEKWENEKKTENGLLKSMNNCESDISAQL